MVIGDKNRFAIQFEMNPDKQPDPALGEWLYGRICWWSCDQQIGSYDDATTIRDVAIESQRFLSYEGKRQDGALAAASRDEIVHVLRYALFDDHGQSDEELAADGARYRPFYVTPAVDAFDQCEIFLVEGKEIARLIWRSHMDSTLNECALAPGEFDRILKDFLAILGFPLGARP